MTNDDFLNCIWQQAAHRISAAFGLRLPFDMPCAEYYSTPFEWYKTGYRIDFQLVASELDDGGYFSVFSHTPIVESYACWFNFKSRSLEFNTRTESTTPELEQRFYFALWMLGLNDEFEKWCERKGEYFSGHDIIERLRERPEKGQLMQDWGTFNRALRASWRTTS